MRRNRSLPQDIVQAGAIIVANLMLTACTVAPPQSGQPGSIAVSEAMGGGGAEGFARATEIVPFVFPRDHGPHEEFRTEWWYFTGNLDTAEGYVIGFQVTFFRHALVAEAPLRSSRWASRDVWFAHLAVGNGESGQFAAAERFARGALGMAGSRALPFKTWVGDWRAESINENDAFPLRLVARTDEVGLDLVVESSKPFVLQGERGLSQKGPEPGNASYYYSATRLNASGTVTLAGDPVSVSGAAWLDREWSTSALSEGQAGWDWFAIQFEDGRDLMLYRMRRTDGATDPHNSGLLIEADGTSRRLGPDEVRYEPGREWKSPLTGATYPVEWRLWIDPLDIELDVVPLIDASELDVAVRYWEGAIRVQGQERAQPIRGRGFLEMTGYVGTQALSDPPPGG